MSTETISPAATPAQPTSGESKPRSQSVQNRAVADAITAGGQLINKALSDPAIIALLAPRGYDEAELRVGLALQQAAQTAFNQRLAAIGAVHEAKKARDVAWKAAKEEYTDFRGTVQAKYPDMATRRALGANGFVPADLQKLVTQATAAYQAARQDPYAGPLAKRSFTPERLEAAIAGLKTLTDLDNAYSAAEGEAGGMVDDRDNAVAKLQAWVREFRANAQFALKKHPNHLATLDL